MDQTCSEDGRLCHSCGYICAPGHVLWLSSATLQVSQAPPDPVLQTQTMLTQTKKAQAKLQVLGGPAAAPRPARRAPTLNKTNHITHNLTHVELAPDRARRVEYRRVALRETAPIPIVAAANHRRHRY